MSIFDTTQTALDRAIAGAHLRHEVLAGNLANVNTPGYQPRDVDFHGALARALESGDDGEAGPETTTAQVTTRADGSGVDAETESAKLAQNGLELNALAQVAGARIDILKYAIGTR